MNVVTPVYAALFALMVFVLSLRVIRMRRRYSIALGSGGQLLLKRAIRAHANCLEYGPLALLLIYMLECQSELHWAAHLLGASLLAGRGLHAFGVSQREEDTRLRVAGMAVTFSVMGLAAAGILLVGVIGSTVEW